jgi:AbrB family looped-hinge helix DNA binding protein
MLATTVKLSSKGQVVIPKSVRESFHWKIGSELTLVATEHGVVLQTKPLDGKKKAVKSLRGFLQHNGKTVSTDKLCKPVEYGHDRF